MRSTGIIEHEQSLRRRGNQSSRDETAIDATALLTPSRSMFSRDAQETGRPRLKIVIIGLSITSSFDNSHATTYRGLVRELTTRGHDVLFLERHTENHAVHRDLPKPSSGRTELYSTLKELKNRFTDEIRDADVVIVGSCVHQGVEIGEWVSHLARGVTAFYDLDTPTTLANLAKGKADYISAALIARYHVYLSLTGGPTLDYIEEHYHPPMARPLHCAVDANLFYPEVRDINFNLGYMGIYGNDRQPTLERLLIEPARRWNKGKFVVAGPQYPRSLRWPRNVKRITDLPPAKYRAFYNAQRFTLNVAHTNMVVAGYTPNVRLFEAAACGTPIISDAWPGLETFFTPDKEILIAHSADEILIYLQEISELERRRIGYRARERVLAKHTARHRAIELENYVLEVLK